MKKRKGFLTRLALLLLAGALTPAVAPGAAGREPPGLDLPSPPSRSTPGSPSRSLTTADVRHESVRDGGYIPYRSPLAESGRAARSGPDAAIVRLDRLAPSAAGSLTLISMR